MSDSPINFVGQSVYLIDALKEPASQKTLEYGCALENIAQSHYFTIQVSQIKITYDHPRFGSFLPVKSANFSYVGFDHLTIPVGIYGNIPLMRRKNVGKLSLTIYDNDRDQIEQSIKNWVNNCFPQGMYVNYLSNMWSTLQYNSYRTDGTLNETESYMVIPADNYQVSRDYEAGGAKMINLGLIVIGGNEKLKSEVNIEKTEESTESKVQKSVVSSVNRDTVHPATAAIGQNTYSWEENKSKKPPIQTGISKHDAGKTHLPTEYNIIKFDKK